MAETSNEIRRELELTRAHLGNTIVALERKVNPKHILDDHPITVVGLALGTGVLLATTGAAGRAARGIRDQVQTGASTVNDSASSALDRLLQAVVSAATNAVAVKVAELLDGSRHSITRSESQERMRVTGVRAA
jgi:hypothetical protein